MPKTCAGNPESNRSVIADFDDDQIKRAIAKHADPAWWKKPEIQRENQAYLRRWGSMLRREARKRGLL